MNIDFTCKKCESGFELEDQDLIDGTQKLVCPQCGAKTSAAMLDNFVAALTELRAQVAAVAKKFTVTLGVESEELEEAAGSAADEDEADEESEELDFDSDDDAEDDDQDEAEEEDRDER